MSLVFRPVNLLLAPVAVAAVLGLAACGGNDAKVKDLQHSVTQVRKQAAAVRKSTAKTAADLKAGKITSAEAQKEVEQQAAAITKSAKDTASKAIDAAKGQSGVPADAQKALDDAQKQLNAN